MARPTTKISNGRTSHTTKPTMEFEEELRGLGFQRVAGLDEAGRGPMAGPIVAAAVVLNTHVDGLNDSKQLDHDVREQLYDALYEGGHAISVCIIDSTELDTIGLQVANYAAMLRAAQSLQPSPDFLLVDGFALPHCVFPQKRLIKGDCRSASIAAASIIAKVTRDRIMHRLDEDYPGYGFAQHKGYCTREHFDALRALGPSPVHRRCFAPLYDYPETSPLFDFGGEE